MTNKPKATIAFDRIVNGEYTGFLYISQTGFYEVQGDTMEDFDKNARELAKEIDVEIDE